MISLVRPWNQKKYIEPNTGSIVKRFIKRFKETLP